ncbi:hypothetical protein EMIHUDRAFT_121874 [Emiliania huxleyi CCMP1516]|uniref:RING-type domain-containing protein n=2 Tax=Emiliania huxleyi TaxID=2903 RepID=A0A0D3KXZ6_EMIH1|nr:hypothetical protein EMIHUDRAFT_121874 [Emiliania huxleyi CCMP1516]EOD40631.1 hypothetical protein EMIHUDRAFT_121874 [Emiliania huxleyi CCMP1516]|eukprot:XP_005793060.1 hypothetical protein EMIHUDRAFT_121874 [Emiliania huxleyi CCMP1516]
MLDEGCIELMHSGQTAGQAGIKPYRVQILEIKPTQADRYRVIISDGRHYMQARHLAPPPPASPEPATAPQRCRRRKPRTRCTQLTVPRFALAQAMLSATLSPMLQGVGIRALSIVRIDNHVMNTVILILQFALISNDQPQIGLPQQSFPAPPSDAEESKKARKKKKKKAGSSGEAGPSSQECELQAPAEEASTAEAAAAAATAAVEVELAVALEESTRLTGEAARAAEEQAPFAAPAGAVAAASDAQPAPTETPMRETPPPVAVVSLADARFDTGRPAVPESSLGGETTCIVCFTRPKNHLAVPCGHQCACGPCSAKMPQCPYCRAPVMVWMDSSRIRSV